jgi:hypothetical protein
VSLVDQCNPDERAARGAIDLDPDERRSIHDAGDDAGLRAPALEHLFERRAVSFVCKESVVFVLRVPDAETMKIGPV